MELPDWLRAIALIGQHDDDYYLIQVTEDGELYALTMGEDAGGDLHTLAVDADGQLIMVPRGESGNYMAVDASGFLTTILKGDHEGALRTVTVDDDGRLSAFVVDSSDVWERIVTVGNAELAARLGGFNVYDRRGTVYQAEDFSQGLGRFQTGGSGAGNDVSICVDYWERGGYAAKLTAGSTFDHSAQIWLRRNFFPLGLFGLQWSFAIDDAIEDCRLALVVHTGTRSITARIQYDNVNHDLEYYDTGGGYTTIDDLTLDDARPYLFNVVKFVVDFDAQEYIRIQVNQQEIDLTGSFFPSTASAEAASVEAGFFVTGRSGHNDVVRVDNMVLTGAEPA